MRVFDYKFDHKNRPENFSPSRFLLPSSPFFLVIFKVERTQKRPGLYCSRYFPRVVFVVTSTENDRVKNFPVDFCGRIYGRTRAQNDRSIFQSLVRSMNPLGIMQPKCRFFRPIWIFEFWSRWVGFRFTMSDLERFRVPNFTVQFNTVADRPPKTTKRFIRTSYLTKI